MVDRWAQIDTLEEARRALAHQCVVHLARSHIEEVVLLLSNHLLSGPRRRLGTRALALRRLVFIVATESGFAHLVAHDR